VQAPEIETLDTPRTSIKVARVWLTGDPWPNSFLAHP